jgi:ribokinase
MKNNLVVVGSLNMDFVVSVDHLPAPGETVLGRNFLTIPGGKGANQACAAGKLAVAGMRVKMIGRVGTDSFADHLRASLSAAGVDVSGVHASRSQPTGVALIWVNDQGQNSIVVASGSNMELTAAGMEGFRQDFRGARAVLFQLESPLPAVTKALSIAREEGAETILDPAPARPLDGGLLRSVDYLTPNESEALLLLGRPPGEVDAAAAPELARALLALGPKAVILKLGDKGCFYSNGAREIRTAGFAVKAADTTAAGDTFNAAFAVALAEDMPLEASLRFANAAAAISVTRLGAQASVPARAEVDQFLAGSAGMA